MIIIELRENQSWPVARGPAEVCQRLVDRA
jgi:hypothetical protein